MERERRIRGEQAENDQEFDWQALADELRIPRAQAFRLYQQARAGVPNHARNARTRTRSTYLRLLAGARRRVRPAPGKMSATTRMQTGALLRPESAVAQSFRQLGLSVPGLDQEERAGESTDDDRVSGWLTGLRTDPAHAEAAYLTGENEPENGSASRLPPLILRRMERAFGYSFADVKIHADSSKVQGGQHAVTEGRDVYFAPGHFQPGTEQGDWLIGHELAHVVQQNSPNAPTYGRDGERDGSGVDTRTEAATPALEAEASRAASAATTGRAASVQLRASYGSAQAFDGETPETTSNNDEGTEEKKLTEEEIEQLTQEAQQQGEQQGEQTVPEQEPAEPVEEPAVDPDLEGATPEQTPMPEGQGGQGEQTFAATPAAGAGAPFESFQALKSGALSKWDDEIAWHQYFKGGGGATDGIQIDRNALIADALGGGALAGFQAGLKNIAIDTAINMASSRIPYLQGFVEAARIIYDPQAWLEGTAQATVGNMVNGGKMLWEGITSGDPIAALDGLLTILDGINNVIGTLSSLCWIVAAASFLLSFICPAALPFAALAANWAVTLGTISTAFGVYITLGRALVIGLRVMQIKFGDADPATLLERGERLRAQTQAFTGEVTTRAGNKLRDRAQTALQNRGQPQPQPAPTSSNTSSAKPQTRMQRVMNALNTGATVVTGGGDPRAATRSARESLATSRQVTQAHRGTGEYANTPGGGPRSRRQQAADMEDAGATVFTGQGQRDRFNRQTGGDDAPQPVNRELVRQQQAATERLREASDADNDAQRRLQQAQQDADDARQRLRNLEGDENLQGRIKATEDQHRADQQRVREAEQSIESQKHVVRVLEGELQRRIETGESDIAIGVYRQGVSDAKIELANREIAAANARVAEANSNWERVRTRQPMVGAQGRDQDAQNNLTGAQDNASGAAGNRSDAQQGLRDANAEFNTSDRIGGMRQKASDDLRERDTTQRQQWYFDFTGTGPSDLHGHNKGAGVTGAGGGLAESIGTSSAAEFTEDPKDDTRNPLGIWERTTSGEDVDLIGESGGRGPTEDYQGQLQSRFDNLKSSLPAPPEGIQKKVDGTVTAYADLDEEKRQVAFQQEAMASLLTDADESLSALDAIQAISDANKEAIGTHQQELGEKVTAQGELKTHATETQGQAGEGESSGASTAQTVGGFLPRFLEMLNIVPSRIIGGKGGAGEIQQVNDSAEKQQQNSADAKNTAAEGITQANSMTRDTQASQQSANEELNKMTSVDQQISAEQLEATDGRAFLQQTMEDAEKRQGELDTEMERLQSEHSTAVQSGSTWAASHEQLRVAGLGDLDGIVELMDQGTGGN